jgi:hypothetical protein
MAFNHRRKCRREVTKPGIHFGTFRILNFWNYGPELETQDSVGGGKSRRDWMLAIFKEQGAANSRK